MHFVFMNVSATHVAILRVVKTLIPLNFHEFFISANFANNLIIIPVFKEVVGIFVLSYITFFQLIFICLRD